MTTFVVYLRLGFEHLLDLAGSDHVLFLVALCSVHSLAQWPRLVAAVTAFTLGHSASLALATLDVVRVDSGLVEFLIPVTIVAAAVVAAWPRGEAGGEAPPPRRVGRRRAHYAATLLFGVVHGLGFSGFLRLVLGEESGIALPLLAFNVGLELAQIVVAGGVLAFTALAVRFGPLSRSAWTRVLACVAGVPALVMAVERWPL